MDISDGDPPPAFNLDVNHNIFYTVQFYGTHAVNSSDVVRFIKT